MAQMLEMIMLVCFGISWPMNAYKAYKAHTARGTSLVFILMILFGYVCGITAKIVTGNINYVLIAYFLNVATVGVNLAIYFHNRALDQHNGQMPARRHHFHRPAAV